MISLGLPYNTTSDNRQLAIKLAGLVVNWERQRQNEMKIFHDGDGSSQNNDVSSITSNGADPKRPEHGNDEEIQAVSLFKVLEAVVKNGRFCHDLEEERNLFGKLDDEWYYETFVSGQDFSGGMISVMECSGGNQIEGVDWKLEGLMEGYMKGLRVCKLMYALRVGILKKSTWELHVLYLVSPNVLSFVVESLGSGTCSILREVSKLVGTLELVGALSTDFESLLQI
nr:phosphatidylinositol 3- and 4-kinase family protein with FAT domain isoform 1 [Tanacetum cinerariifolium]